MKPTYRNVLLLLALASFQGMSLAQDNPPTPKPQETEVRPPEPKRGEPEVKPRGDRPRPEGENVRGQELQRQRSNEPQKGPERGRGPTDELSREKREADGRSNHGPSAQHRGPQMRQGADQQRGPESMHEPTERKGLPDGDHAKEMPRGRDQHRGSGPMHGHMQHKGPPMHGQNHHAERRGFPQRDQQSMRHQYRGEQNLGHHHPRSQMGSAEGHHGKPEVGQPRFEGPRFQPQHQRGRMSDQSPQRGDQFRNHRPHSNAGPMNHDFRDQGKYGHGDDKHSRGEHPEHHHHQGSKPRGI